VKFSFKEKYLRKAHGYRKEIMLLTGPKKSASALLLGVILAVTPGLVDAQQCKKKGLRLTRVEAETSWWKTSPKSRCESGKLLKFRCRKESPTNDQIHVSIKNTRHSMLERLELRPELGSPYSLDLKRNEEETYLFKMPASEPERLGIDTFAKVEACIEYFTNAELKAAQERQAKARKAEQRRQEIYENCLLAKMPSGPDPAIRGIIYRKCIEISNNPSMLDRLRY
jgi:hypothetical protein